MHKEMNKIFKNYEKYLENKHLFFLHNAHVFNHHSKIITTSNYNYSKYISRDNLSNKLTYFSKDDIIKIINDYFYDTYKIKVD